MQGSREYLYSERRAPRGVRSEPANFDQGESRFDHGGVTAPPWTSGRTRQRATLGRILFGVNSQGREAVDMLQKGIVDLYIYDFAARAARTVRRTPILFFLPGRGGPNLSLPEKPR